MSWTQGYSFSGISEGFRDQDPLGLRDSVGSCWRVGFLYKLGVIVQNQPATQERAWKITSYVFKMAEISGVWARAEQKPSPRAWWSPTITLTEWTPRNKTDPGICATSSTLPWGWGSGNQERGLLKDPRGNGTRSEGIAGWCEEGRGGVEKQ